MFVPTTSQILRPPKSSDLTVVLYVVRRVYEYCLANCFISTMELKDNTVIVVLGASGDLAKKKTVRNPRVTC